MPTTISSWREGKAIGAWLAAGLGLIWVGSWFSSEENVILWIAWLLGLGILLGRFAVRSVGPLFFYDVVRTARRNRLIPVRCLYGILLTVALFGVYTSWFGWPKEDWREVFHQPPIQRGRLPDFAQSFFYVFMFGQLAVVALVTPLFTAGAVAEERERRTFDLLLTTAMSDREIILGLFASRMANLGLVLLTGLPILSVMPFLGGIEPFWVMTMFVTTSMTMLTLGALSILTSVLAKSSLGAVLASYFLSVILLPLVIGMTSLVTASQPGGLTPYVTLIALIALSIFEAVLIVTSLLAAAGQLRTPTVELTDVSWPPRIPPDRSESIKAQPSAYREATVPELVWETSRPAVTDPPVLWKDYYRKNIQVLMMAWSVAAMVIALSCLGSLLRSTSATNVVGDWAVIVVAAILLPVPILAAQMVGRERETGTLDCLLVTPLSTEEIFANKWQASILGTRWPFVILAVVLLLTVLGGVIHPLAYVMLVVSWLVYAALLSCLGLFFSTFVRSTRIAMLFSVLLVLASGVGTQYAAPVPAGQIHNLKDWVLCVMKDVASPLTTLKVLAFGSERTQANLREIQVAMLAVLVAVLLAFGLWELTLYEFRRTTRKG